MRRISGFSALLALFCSVGAVAEEVAAESDKPFYLTIDTPPAPELSPAEAHASFTIAPGFTVELVAAEPLVEDPVAITWDEQGQLYVVEMRGYMPDAYGNGEKDPVGVVVRLSDSNGDDTLDQREVLLDKLVLPRAIAIVNEGLLVGEPPNLWLCPSVSGHSADIDCGKKRRLGSYGDQPGSVEHAENGLLLGIDNWLYSAKSNRRLKLRDGELVVEPTLFRGQWGISQDDAGRLLYNTNSNLLLGDAYDAQQVIAAGNSGAPGLGEAFSRNDQLFAVRVNTGVNRAYVPGVLRADGRLNRPTSASGMAAYRGNQFASDYSADVFVAEPAANAVAQLRLQRDGLRVVSDHVLYPNDRWGEVEFFASTDERFRPVDVSVGPDGALYVVDMYRGIIQDHYFLSDELRAQILERQLDKPVGMGRIWRIRATGNAARGDAANPVKLTGAASAELLELLGHPNAWQRATAQRLLIGRSESGLDRALERLVKSGSPHSAVHALWTLAGRGTLNRRVLRSALTRPEQAALLAALRAGKWHFKRGDLLKLARRNSDPVIQQQLTLNLAPFNAQRQVQRHLLSAIKEVSNDSYRRAAIKAAAHRHEYALLQSLQDDGGWSAELEQSTQFVQQLVQQGFRSSPGQGASWLDLVGDQKAEARWLQVAVLDGLYDVSRAEGFERVALQEEHPIFRTADESLWPAIARARRAFTWQGDELAAEAKPLSPEQRKHRELGADFYASRCATCHGADGAGIASLAPPLAESEWVTGPTERLVRIILHGLRGPIEVAGETWNGVMPGHVAQSDFTDEVASGLLTHLHRAWGHTGRAIDPEFVTETRRATADRQNLWTAEELANIDINTHYRMYEGRYGSPGFALEFVYNGRGLEVKSGIFNGPMLALKEDQFLFEPRKLLIEFVLDDAGAVTGLRMPSGDGEMQLPRLGD